PLRAGSPRLTGVPVDRAFLRGFPRAGRRAEHGQRAARRLPRLRYDVCNRRAVYDGTRRLRPDQTAPVRGEWAMKLSDVILQTATQVLTFIILAFAIYILLAGHNHPGGGFVAGLITASAFVLLYIAFGLRYVRSLLPVDF